MAIVIAVFFIGCIGQDGEIEALGLTITKEANVTSATVGDTILYWYNITNTGTVNLTNLTVTDSMLGNVSLDKNFLEPGDVARGTDTYIVTESDICGCIVNYVCANVTDPNGKLLRNMSSAEITVQSDYCADLTITKTADKESAFIGETVHYTYRVNNTGNVNLTNLTITDIPYGSVTDLDKTALIPNEVATGYLNHTVNESEICGPIANYAVTTAVDPCNYTIYNVSGDVTVTTNYTADLTITKVANRTEASVGNVIKYWINVSNTGNVNLTDVVVSDPKFNLSNTIAILTPDESKSFNFTYTVSNSDLCQVINNSAIATAKDPCNNTVSNVSENIFVTASPLAGLIITKEANRTEVTVGDVITYWINVTNTGTANISDIWVNDSLLELSDTIPTLAPGENKSYNFTYTISESDICQPINNTATANATDPCGGTVGPESDSWSVSTNYTASLNITKTANRSEVSVGDVITYWINVTNTGNVNLSNIVVTDNLLELSNTIPTLAPGETTLYERTYIVKLTDIGAPLNNTAFASGTDPCGRQVDPPVTASASVKTPIIELRKSGSPKTVAPGGTVTYTITYSNTGGAAHDVVITERYPQGVTFISASPAPDSGTNNRWTIDTLPATTLGKIVITVKVPEPRNFSFTESGGVSGEGVVMVSKELSTEQAPYSLQNVVILTGKGLPSITATEVTKVSGVEGTRTSLVEHGSGIYSSDENINVYTTNKSISLVKSTEAEYKPTSFDFGDFEVNFTTKWNQNICSKNRLIYAAIRKRIDDATYLEDETISEMNETSSSIVFDSSFNGSLYIGARTNDSAIAETYIGEFNISQTITIGKAVPTPTPTPDWLLCPFPSNECENNMASTP
jgi:uncharacterized repeat protein (TIGR01451 family)